MRRVLIGTAIAATLLTIRFPGRADAADVRTQMTVTATVSDPVEVGSLYQATTLVVDAQDVKRGYVSVSGGSRLRITHHRGYLLDFRPTHRLFRSAAVTRGGRASEIRAEGGSIYEPPSTAGSSTVVLDYRFYLDESVRPGTYAWPMAVTVLPM